MTAAKPHRIEITLSDDKLASLDAARQHEPRASFIKRALEAALSSSETPEHKLPIDMGDVPEEPIKFHNMPAPKRPRKVSARQQALNDAKAKKR